MESITELIFIIFILLFLLLIYYLILKLIFNISLIKYKFILSRYAVCGANYTFTYYSNEYNISAVKACLKIIVFSNGSYAVSTAYLYVRSR
ncbi:hypothetical protein TTX_0984 [Thermoproteus tenax Kra 1]|uniref:Uncharacterized protein n=1 Tax=Thermoproteus tenax (strain ATCC 35583 / DSM 2078 / JCM 9277 / NBRC 100435 / Kra 1) TaxID=768679 RepID=G4RPY7_THETK|nr:hypothetical protein TTX_0984 [Thermoproteus tenax Kra 1]